MTERESRWEDLTFDENDRLVDVNGPVEFADYGPPPPITWTPLMDLGEVFGRRAATMNARGPNYDLRIASEVFEAAGGWYAHLIGEDQWWQWVDIPDAARPARPGKAICWPARYVWAETRRDAPL